MKRFSLKALVTAAALSVAVPAAAETVAIVNARILTAGPAGEIANGTVVIRDGVIASVGQGGAPAGARVIDAQGGVVTPGIVAADSGLGGVDVGAVGDDLSVTTSDLSAAFDVQYGLNPWSFTIPVARLGGVTRAIVTPGYDRAQGRELLFAGQAAVVHLGQGADMLVRPKAAMMLDLGEGGAARAGGARGASFVALKAALDDVRWYMRNRAAYDRGEARGLKLSRADLEALVPVVEGRMPVIVSVHRAADIQQVLKLAREERLKVILDGAEEGWMVADQIARAGVPVIVNPLSNLPGSFESLGSTMENAARLEKAGVTVILKSQEGGVHRVRETRYNAGNAVAQGMSWEGALKAITINPARAFGMGDRFGSIEPGKEGDVVIWSGDPFEPLSQPVAVFVRGQQQPLTSRGLELRDRYRDLNARYGY